MHTRRKLLLALSVGALAGPQWVWAQTAGRSYRIGWLNNSGLLREPYDLAFIQRLSELGFVEGRNLVLERRSAENKIERLPVAAAELGRLKCDAYFGSGSEANLAALTRASGQAPIVFIAVDFDPVATGDVASLARPGGRVTGITAQQSELPAKRLELLKELLPGLRKVAVFTNELTTAQLALVRGTARRLELEVHVVDFRRPPFDYPAGFAEVARAKADALFVLGSSLWVPARRLIPDLALKAKLPTVFHHAQWAEAGGLMSYGFSFPKMWRRGAEMMASVLRGAKPGEIPMEQPTDFELVFNAKTAKVLGIKIPQPMLIRADRVVE